LRLGLSYLAIWQHPRIEDYRHRLRKKPFSHADIDCGSFFDSKRTGQGVNRRGGCSRFLQRDIGNQSTPGAVSDVVVGFHQERSDGTDGKMA